MRTLGDKLAHFDNLKDNTVAEFNLLFDVPLTGFKDDDIVVIGEITKNTTTRQLLINNIAIEHSFERRTKSEDDYLDLADNAITDDDDPDWLLYFV